MDLLGKARQLIPLPLYPLAAALLLWPALFGGEALLPARLLPHFTPWQGLAPPEARLAWDALLWDGMAQHYPWRLFLGEALAGGNIPLWNPHQLSGTPFLANGQSAPLYPLHALYALPGVPAAVAIGWVAWLHLTLAGLFTHLWTRQLGAGAAGAALAGLAFMLSGFATAWLALPSFLTAACWIPLALCFLEKALAGRSVRWAAACGGALGLMLLGGHLQVAFYGLLAVVLRVGWEKGAALQRRDRAHLWSAVGLGALALALGIALAAPQLLPALELSRLSHRAGEATAAGYAAYVAYALPAVHLLGLMAPQAFGLSLRGEYFGAASYPEYAGSVGAVALLFALAALFLYRRGERAARPLFPALLALLALLLALGTPLNALLYFGVPGFSQTGAPARVLVLFCLGAAALAGLGLHGLLAHLRAGAGERRTLLAAGLAAALPLTAFAGGWLLLAAREGEQVAAQALPGIGFSLRLTAAALLLGGLALLGARAGRLRPAAAAALLATAALGLTTAELLVTARGAVPTAPRAWAYPETPEIAVLPRGERLATLNDDWSLFRAPEALLPPNAALAYGLRDAAGYDSLQLRSYRVFTTRLAGRDPSPPENGNLLLLPPRSLRSALFPLLGARQAVMRGSEGDWLAFHLPHAREAYLAREWRALADEPALDWLEERLEEHAGAAVAALAPGEDEGVAAGGDVLADERPSPNRRSLRVQAQGDGLLVLAEGWAPGWRARVDPAAGEARETAVRRANVTFQAVAVPAGESRVELRYEPASFRIGLFLALLALAALAALLLAPATRPASRPASSVR